MPFFFFFSQVRPTEITYPPAAATQRYNSKRTGKNTPKKSGQTFANWTQWISPQSYTVQRFDVAEKPPKIGLKGTTHSKMSREWRL